MKVLWLVNALLPDAANLFDMRPSLGGSWLIGQIGGLANVKDIELTVVCPITGASAVKKGSNNGVTYIAVSSGGKALGTYFKKLLQEHSFDVVHVFGTEYSHTLEMLHAVNNIPTLVSIQGLVYRYKEHYFAGMPAKYKRYSLLKSFVRKIVPAHGGVLQYDYKQMCLAATSEVQAIEAGQNFAGRTEWDKSGVLQIHPGANYFHYGEILRPCFHNQAWELEKCEQHRIFVSQGNYPIKGLHMVLRQLPKLIKQWPKIKIVVAGTAPYTAKNFFVRATIDYLYEYQSYIAKLIKQLKLEEHVVFTGVLNEEEMCREYLKSHVYLSASSIENSPNSLGEAMMLGMPCVSSHVGGVGDMLLHGKEGLLYPFNETYMMSWYINQIFSSDTFARQLGSAAKKHAEQTHNTKKITAELLDIYKDLGKQAF